MLLNALLRLWALGGGHQQGVKTATVREGVAEASMVQGLERIGYVTQTAHPGWPLESIHVCMQHLKTCVRICKHMQEDISMCMCIHMFMYIYTIFDVCLYIYIERERGVHACSHTSASIPSSAYPHVCLYR